jgi:hypothetical protein
MCIQLFAKILRQQPEMKYAQKRERLFNAVVAELPEHMRGVMTELRALLELVSIARESTAFLIAFEIGRESGRRDALQDPCVMLAPNPERRALPATGTCGLGTPRTSRARAELTHVSFPHDTRRLSIVSKLSDRDPRDPLCYEWLL